MDLNKYTDIIKNIPFHVVQNINSWTFRNSLYALDTTTFSTRTSWIEQPYDSAIPCLSIYSWTCLKESMSEYLQRPCSSIFTGGYPQYSQYGISLRDSGHTNGRSKKKGMHAQWNFIQLKIRIESDILQKNMGLKIIMLSKMRQTQKGKKICILLI